MLLDVAQPAGSLTRKLSPRPPFSVETARRLEQAALDVGVVRLRAAQEGPYQRPPEMDSMPYRMIQAHKEATLILSSVVRACCESGMLAWLEMDCRHIPLPLKDQSYIASKKRRLFTGSVDDRIEKR